MRTFISLFTLVTGNFAFAAAMQQQPLTGGADPSMHVYYCAIKQGPDEVDFDQVVASSQNQATLKTAVEKLTLQNGELMLRSRPTTAPSANVTEVDCQELK
jgi:hypothetical protein